MMKVLRKIGVFFATGAYVSLPLARDGRRQSGAGSAGTLVGLACALLLPSGTAFAVLTALSIPLSIALCVLSREELSLDDDPRIVLDEIVGMWCSLLFLPRTLPVLLGAFGLFRLMDIAKPFPVRQLERLPGSLGIVADDVAAGLLACALLHLVRFLYGTL